MNNPLKGRYIDLTTSGSCRKVSLFYEICGLLGFKQENTWTGNNQILFWSLNKGEGSQLWSLKIDFLRRNKGYTELSLKDLEFLLKSVKKELDSKPNPLEGRYIDLTKDGVEEKIVEFLKINKKVGTRICRDTQYYLDRIRSCGFEIVFYSGSSNSIQFWTGKQGFLKSGFSDPFSEIGLEELREIKNSLFKDLEEESKDSEEFKQGDEIQFLITNYHKEGDWQDAKFIASIRQNTVVLAECFNGDYRDEANIAYLLMDQGTVLLRKKPSTKEVIDDILLRHGVDSELLDQKTLNTLFSSGIIK